MNRIVTWADLQPGDVLMNDNDFPVVVVLECVSLENTFVWFNMYGRDAGQAFNCDFAGAQMWTELLWKSYKTVLRGNKVVNVTKKSKSAF